jgi:hypothetical protein
VERVSSPGPGLPLSGSGRISIQATKWAILPRSGKLDVGHDTCDDAVVGDPTLHPGVGERMVMMSSWT